MLKDKIQLALIIVVTILLMTQIYTLVELVRLNSIEDGKQCRQGQRLMSKRPYMNKDFSFKYKFDWKIDKKADKKE